jgi:hypothetical protein
MEKKKKRNPQSRVSRSPCLERIKMHTIENLGGHTVGNIGPHSNMGPNNLYFLKRPWAGIPALVVKWDG